MERRSHRQSKSRHSVSSQRTRSSRHESSRENRQDQKAEVRALAEDLYLQHASENSALLGKISATTQRSPKSEQRPVREFQASISLMKNSHGKHWEETILLTTAPCKDETSAVDKLESMVRDLLRYKREIEADKDEVRFPLEEEGEWVDWKYLRFEAKERKGWGERKV